MGSLIGGLIQGQYDQQGANQALTGYNYLTGPGGVQGYVGNGNTANSAEAQLLGTAPMQNGTANAFKNYLGSTGYNFNLQQGDAAINGNQAARGILNSGATGKALTSYGQGLASNYFNNYLNQLSGMGGQGLEAANMTGQAGTTGGGNAGQLTSDAGNAYGAGVNNFLTPGGSGFDIGNIFG